MIRGIDHLVIACADPDAAAAELESAIGLAATGGGRHDGAGTFNRIAWLSDGSYLELIGVDDRQAAAGSPISRAVLASLDDTGGGLVTYALRDDDLQLTAGELPEGAFGPLTRGRRVRPDGNVVEWTTVVPSQPLRPDGVPFLIQHVPVGAEWSHAALDERAGFRHPIGSPVLLARLDLATDDPPSSAALLHDRLGLDFWAVADLAVCEIGPHVIRLRPRREMAVPAIVTVGAEVDAPVTVDLLGLRFDVERVERAAGGGRPAVTPGEPSDQGLR
jgi:hypothetical protein